jgi:citronellol/citronellal dehydrogenase
MPSVIFAENVLAGQVALVSGGGAGPGRAVAAELSACGAQVVVAGPEREPLDETVAICADGRCEAVVCDVREEDQAEALAGEVVERHGRIDTLVNDAGGAYAHAAPETGTAGLDTALRLEMRGTWLVTRAVAVASMIPREEGRIINLAPPPLDASDAATHVAAARAAVENLTRVLSIEWSRFNIKLNAIAPQRPGDPREQSWLAAYLASPAGDYSSGAVYTLDAARAS